MELSKLNGNIIGIIENKKMSFNKNDKVNELITHKKEESLKIVKLDDEVLKYKLKDLSMSDIYRVLLASLLNEKEIILTNFFEYFNYKEREYFKKLFKKISNNYHKKIILIEPNNNNFMGLCDEIYIKVNNKIYKTKDPYDDNLYEKTDMPEIVKFIKEVNKKVIDIDNYTDINELIKAIYRSVK